MNEEMKFVIIDDNDNEIECEVLFTFDSLDTEKNYLVYTDHTTDENGNLSVYAATYDPLDEDANLIPVESEEELELVSSVYEEIMAEMENKEE